MKITNLYDAPKSTILALILLISFTMLHKFQILDKDTYGLLSVPLLGFVFTDIMKENKKEPGA